VSLVGHVWDARSAELLLQCRVAEGREAQRDQLKTIWMQKRGPTTRREYRANIG
jgi:hypothetical protein